MSLTQQAAARSAARAAAAAGSASAPPPPQRPSRRPRPTCTALESFDALELGDLTFKVNDVLEILDDSEDWWKCRFRGRVGAVPSNLVSKDSVPKVVHRRKRPPAPRPPPPTPPAKSDSRSRPPPPKPAARRRPSSSSSVPRNSRAPPPVPTKVLQRKRSSVRLSARYDNEGARVSSPRTTSVVSEYTQEVLDEDDRLLGFDYTEQMKKIDKNETKYWKSLFELLTTEFSYYADLKRCELIFVDVFEKKFGRELRQSIFSVWTEMAVVHERVFVALFDELDVHAKKAHFGAEFNNNNTTTTSITGFALHTKEAQSAELSLQMLQRASKLDAYDSVFKDQWEFPNRVYDPDERRRRSEFLQQTSAGFAKTFLEMSAFLRTTIPYIVGYPRALEVVESFSSSKKEAEKLLVACEQDSRLDGLHLRDYLIKPIQRICKYPLLYREIIGFAEKVGSSSKDVDLCKNAQSALIGVADQVNKMLKRSEQMSSTVLEEMKSRMRPQSDVSKLNLDDVSNRLVRVDDLELLKSVGFEDLNNVQSNMQGRTFSSVLTTHALLFFEKYNNILGKYRLKLVGSISLVDEKLSFGEACVVESSRDSWSVALHYESNRTSYLTMKTPGAGKCDGWVQDLTEVLSNVANAHNRLVQVENQERERRRRRSLPGLPRSSSGAKRRSTTNSIRGTPKNNKKRHGRMAPVPLGGMIKELEKMQIQRGLVPS